MVLDATVAGAAANSYLTVAEADAFAAGDPVSGDAWLAALDDAKERSLIAAAEDVDLYRRAAGVRYVTTQARLFPRSVDWIGTPPVAFVLPDVKRGQYEQAVYLLRYGALIADSQARRARGLYSFSDDDGSGTQALSPDFGLYAPKMTERLDRIGSSGRARMTLVSVPMTSSYETTS